MKRLLLMVAAAVTLLVSGCASKPVAYNYAAWQRDKPASMLILPPLNDTTEVDATASVWANASFPLAEAGYYVFPVALVDATLRQNGVTTAYDAHGLEPAKLNKFFGADAAVYIKVKEYGTKYKVISSETKIVVEARIVDLRSGSLLWMGSAQASSAETQSSSGGIIGMLVLALVSHVVESTTNASYVWAGIADYRLLQAPQFNGVLLGPRSPNYGKPPPSPP